MSAAAPGIAPLRRLRGGAQRMARPLVRALAGRVHPDVLTAASMLVCACVGAALALGAPAPLLVPATALRLALDVLDGEVARAAGATTPFGGGLGDVGDALGDVLLYGGLAVGAAFGGGPLDAGGASLGGDSGGVFPAAVVCVVVFGVLGELAGVAVAAHGGPRCQEGPVGKVERMVGMSAVALAGPGAAVGIAWVLAGLTAATVARRVVAARGAFARASPGG